MATLWFDCETYSECDLKSAGTHAYAEHPSTEITVAQWALDDGEPHVIDCTEDAWQAGDGWGLTELLDDPSVTVVAHNSMFDRTLLRHCWGIDVPVERWQDTMIKAMAHGLPGALDKIGQIMGLPSDQAKDKRGRDLIQLFCKPRPKNQTLRRATRETHPKEWNEFLEYSRQDIVAMRAIDSRLPDWNYRQGHQELALWHLDQRINDRGVAVDVDLARSAITAVAIEQKRLKAEVQEHTDNLVGNVSQRDSLLAFICAEYGVDLPDMKADTVKRRLEDPTLPDGVKLLLAMRLEGTKTSTAKYKALINATSEDGRLRNTLQFCGASRTGRWAGRLVQLQNLPRGTMSDEDVAEGIDALKAGCADLFFPNVMGLTANTVRGCLVSAPGKKLVVADLSNIEGRALAWLAGESWKLKAFAEFDAGKGHDLYKLAYSRSFNIDPQDVTKQGRQIGKVQELACFAADTPVVTKAGVKCIAAITTEDMLWDGTEWVPHEGLIYKGKRATVNLCGVEVTPDHLIRTKQTWTPAQQLVSNENTLCQALETGSESLLCLVLKDTSAGRAIATWCASSARAALSRTLCSITTYEKGPAPAALCVRASKPDSGERSFTAMQTSSQMPHTASAFSIESPHASTGATTPTTLDTPATAAGGYKFTLLGETIDAFFSGIWLALKGGTRRFLNLTGLTSTAITLRATCGSSLSAKTRATGEKCGICSEELMSLRPVYDLLNVGPRNRFMILTNRGPVVAHNCGYEGGPAAYLTFAAVYGMDLGALAASVRETTTAEALGEAKKKYDWAKKNNRTRGLSEEVFTSCQVLVSAWREAHPNIRALWRAADDSVRAAIANPGQVFPIGKHAKARVDGNWLRIRLPSGRYLCYLRPQIDGENRITFFGINQYTRQWGPITTYSGKLVENMTQGVARDILAYRMPDIDASGFEIITSVHDELLTETPDTPEFTADELGRMMATAPSWAAGLPLAAAGFETYRYRKG